MGELTQKINSVRSLLLALAMAFVLVVQPGVVSAAAPTKKPTPLPAVKNNNNTLEISPVRSDLTIEPGKTGQVKTYITNITSSPIGVHPIENDFVAGDEKGTPSIILDENSYAPSHSLKRFMVPLKDVVVGVGEKKEVPVTIVVPKNAKPGGYFGAVRFAPVNPDGTKNLNLSASVASIILLTVPGPVQEDLRMTNFNIRQHGSNAGYMTTPENIDILLRFENKGSIQEAPFGQINVKDTRAKKVIYTYNFNDKTPRDTVLPDSARRWEIGLKHFKKFGHYEVSSTFTYGPSNQTIEVKKSFWIIPTTYLIAIGSLIVGLIALAIFIFTFLRAYKKRILRSNSRYRRR